MKTDADGSAAADKCSSAGQLGGSSATAKAGRMWIHLPFRASMTGHKVYTCRESGSHLSPTPAEACGVARILSV